MPPRYCSLEAIQNASNHGAPAVQVSVRLRENGNELQFEVTEDGPGYDPSAVYAGTGVQNMHDRLGALDGQLSIVTAPGDGTVVTGSVPLGHSAPHRRRVGDATHTLDTT